MAWKTLLKWISRWLIWLETLPIFSSIQKPAAGLPLVYGWFAGGVALTTSVERRVIKHVIALRRHHPVNEFRVDQYA